MIRPRGIGFWMFLWMALFWGVACTTSKKAGQAGADCTTDADCDSTQNLECRAKKCRTKGEKKAPVARATAIPDAPEVGQKVELDGKASEDPQGEILRFAWTFVKKPETSKIEIQDADKVLASFVPDVAGVYELKLVVSAGADEELRKAEAVVNLTVADRINTKPFANAGEDQLVEPNTKVQLDGSKSSDPEGDALTYRWELKSKPQGSNAKLDEPTSKTPTFQAELEGDYVIELVVTDVQGLSSGVDSVTVRVLEGAQQKPTLTKVTPNEGLAYELKFKIALEGDNFFKNAKVQFGTREFPTDYTSRNKLEATINLALVGQGTHEVRVVNPNRLTSEAVPFTIKEVPPPKITSLTPPRGHIGNRMTIKVAGENFIVGLSEVLFQSIPLPTKVNSPTELEFELDLKNTALGDYPVKVSNPGNRVSNEVTFSVLDQLPKPVLRVLNPPSGDTGSKLPFSVHGQGFGIDAVVVFDGSPLKTNRIRGDELQVDPELDLTNIGPGEYDVWVLNPDGQISNKEKFRVRAKEPTPVLNRMLPFTLYLDQVMTDVAVYGQDFVQGSRLLIDGKEIKGTLGKVTFRSDTFLLADIDLTDRTVWKTPGTFDAIVINPNGKQSNPFKVTVTYLIPSVTALVPAGWSTQCDTEVEVHGSNFVPTVQVKFGSLIFQVGSTTYPLTYVSDKLLKFPIKATQLSVQTYKVVVENGTNASTNAPDFPVDNGSTLTPYPQYVRPSFGHADTLVPILLSPDYNQPNGSQSFKVGSVIEFNGKKQNTLCSSFSTDYCYQLDAELDLTGIKAGSYDLYVVNPCNVRSEPLTFTVEPPIKPYISGFSPAFARIGDKVKIVIRGANFSKSHTLTWKGQPIDTVFTSDTEIETKDPIDFASATLGEIDVQLKNANNQQTDIVKFSVIGRYVPTIAEVTTNVQERGRILSDMQVKGDGFVVSSLVYIDGKVVASKFISTTELRVSGVDATNMQPGTYAVQVKNGSRVSNLYPLYLTPIPSPIIDYTSPSSMVGGSKTSLTLYIYGQLFSISPNATVIITDANAKDISSRFTVEFSSVNYIRGTFDVSALPVGAYTIQIKNTGGEVSNKVVFRVSPPPAPIASSISPTFSYRGVTSQQIAVLGKNFIPGDSIVFNNNVFNRRGTVTSSSVIEGTFNLSNIRYGAAYEVYVLRCLDPSDPNCTQNQKSQVLQLQVNNPPCSLLNCAVDLPNVETCDNASTPPVCRPPCTTNADCTALDSKAPWTCQSGVCK